MREAAERPPIDVERSQVAPALCTPHRSWTTPDRCRTQEMCRKSRHATKKWPKIDAERNDLTQNRSSQIEQNPCRRTQQMGPEKMGAMDPALYLPHNNTLPFFQKPSKSALHCKPTYVLAIRKRLICPMTRNSIRTFWIDWIKLNHCYFAK